MVRAFQVAGESGPFQRMTIIIVCAASLLVTLYSLCFPYLTKRPEFLCKDKNSPDSDYKECKYQQDLCNSNYEMKKNPLHSVNNWSYDYDLYCSKDYYNDLVSTIFFTGGIIGSITLASIPDKYGRKKIFQILIVASLILHLNLLFAIGPIHVIITFFLGGLCSFSFGMCFFIVSEYLPSSTSGIVIGVLNALYPLGGVLVGFFFMFINSWRCLYLIIVLIHIPVTYLTLKYFTESPRWLNVQGRKEECITEMANIARLNGNLQQWEDFLSKNPNFIEGKSDSLPQKKTNYSLFQILSFKSQRKNFLLMTYIWLVSAFCFYGIILNLGRMEGYFFINSIFAFSGEMIGECLSGYLSGIYGRLTVMKFSVILGATSFLLFELFPVSIKFIMIFLSMGGNAGIFNVLAIYSAELFPTPIRGKTCSLLLLICRFSPLIVPTLTQIFGDYTNYLFIIAGYTSAIVNFLLEETLGKPLPDIIPEEMEKEGFLSSNENNSFEKNEDVTITKTSSFRM